MIIQNTAILRVCASCEWIFRRPKGEYIGCPKCGFGHYGARYVYGNNAYKYEKTQTPWMDKKLADYSYKLYKEISQSDKNEQRNDLLNNWELK